MKEYENPTMVQVVKSLENWTIRKNGKSLVIKKMVTRIAKDQPGAGRITGPTNYKTRDWA